MKALLLKALLGAAGQLLALIFASLTKQATFDKVLALAQVEVDKLTGVVNVANDEKRKLAAAAVKDSLKAVGADVKDSVLNLAIELAVNAAKAAVTK